MTNLYKMNLVVAIVWKNNSKIIKIIKNKNKTIQKKIKNFKI